MAHLPKTPNFIMSSKVRITSIKFKNYKAFRDYSVSLKGFNVLVGPNNAGKSTILGAIRILSEAIRKARSKTPIQLDGPQHGMWGHIVDLKNLPVSTENVFHNYEDEDPAIINFRLSNGNELLLYFPEKGVCFLFPKADRSVKSINDFKKHFDLKVSFVPVLGPVEHNERLYAADTARRALLSHGASRNFRNIWYYFPDGFDEFQQMVRQTWPGMDIKRPETLWDGDHQTLRMFCPEQRFDREIYWSGFGFQVWCQMLTYMLQAKSSSLLVIDEPDIYLHSDLQRQLVTILSELGPDIVLATHSTEIISEVDADSLLNVNKRFRSAKRVNNTRELQDVFSILGSNLNPTLTQLAKTKRVVFVEGKDFQIIGRFARKLGAEVVANRSHFAIISVEGFNPQKVKDFSAGMETLGTKFSKFVIFDRDYRCDAEAKQIAKDLSKFCWFATVHDRKEIENYLLEPMAISAAIKKKLADKGFEISSDIEPEGISVILLRITDPLKNKVQSQLVAARHLFEKRDNPKLHNSNSSLAAMDEFDAAWSCFETRMKIVPGKEVLSLLNAFLQSNYGCALTPVSIIESFQRSAVFDEIKILVAKLQELSQQTLPEDE